MLYEISLFIYYFVSYKNDMVHDIIHHMIFINNGLFHRVDKDFL